MVRFRNIIESACSQTFDHRGRSHVHTYLDFHCQRNADWGFLENRIIDVVMSSFLENSFGSRD